jgi:hypothetical protein
VQDLERKLRNAKLEVSNLQIQMQRQRLAELDDPAEWSETTWRRSSSEPDARGPQELIRGVDFQRVRDEIILRSSGLFNLPPAWREYVPDPISESELGKCYYNRLRPPLPPRLFTEHLLELLRNEVFAICPYVDLDIFIERALAIYDSTEPRDEMGIPLDTSRSFLTMFFGYLAYTAQCIQDDIILEHYSSTDPKMIIGHDLADAAVAYFGPVTKKPTIDDVRGALMLALYFRQINEVGGANLWLCVSIKMAQYLCALPFGGHSDLRSPSLFPRIQ